MKKRQIWERLSKSRTKDSWSVEFWQSAGPAARFSAAWLMIDEFYKIRGKNGYSKRLRRTVQGFEQI